MPSIADLRNLLTMVQIVGYVLLLRKLFTTKLFGKYWYFGMLIAVEAARLPIMAALPQRSNIYAHAYFPTAPIVWILYVLVVLEFFQLILKNHPGIATIGRKALAAALTVSAIASGITLLLDLQRTSTEAALLFNFMLLERLVITSLLVLLLCLVAFASHFPVPVSPNIRVHLGIFAIYFSVRTAMLFFRLFFGLEVIGIINVIVHVLAIGCLTAWIVLLKPDGDSVPSPPRPSADEERLIAQLQSINDSLMGSAKR